MALRARWFAGVAPRAYPDTAGYLRVAAKSLWSLQFWAGERLWGVPLFYKLLPNTDRARTVGQLVLSLLAWLALAAVVARRLPAPAWRFAGFSSVLLFSMTLAVIRWDRLVLSESLAISLTVALVAAWIELVASPRPAAVLAVLLLSAPWAFTRDTNGLLLLLTAVPALAWAARRGTNRRLVATLALGLVAIFAVQLAAATRSTQLAGNNRPMLHVIGRRVLVHPGQRRWFLDRGMPPPSARVTRDRKALAGFRAAAEDPATARFLDWARLHGRSTLAAYLATHPVSTVTSTFDARHRLFAGLTTGYLAPGTEALLSPRAVEATIAVLLAAAFVWTAIAGSGGSADNGRSAGRTWTVPVGLLVLQVPHAVLAYQGDTLEIARHAVVMAISTRLALVLVVVFGAADLAGGVRRRRLRT